MLQSRKSGIHLGSVFRYCYGIDLFGLANAMFLFPYSPASMDELRRVLGIANKYALPLWTISRGKNLGYNIHSFPE